MTNYKVVKGDTLSSIAERFSTSVSALVRTNGLKNANKIRAGSNLIIPDAAKTGELLAIESSTEDSTPRSTPVLDEIVVTGIRPNTNEWFQAPRVYWLLAGALLVLLTIDD